jgi:hypothetical protein
LLFGLVLAVWVFIDCRKRGANPLKWALGAFVMGPIFASIYHARRPLLDDEVREGGPDWIVARDFALLWLPYMGIVVFWTVVTLFFTDQWNFDGESSNHTIRNLLTMMFMLGCWLVPVALGLLLSVMLVVSDDVEGRVPDVDNDLADSTPSN